MSGDSEYVLVPREPTPEMVERLCSTLYGVGWGAWAEGDSKVVCRASVSSALASALLAAPSTPLPQGEVAGLVERLRAPKKHISYGVNAVEIERAASDLEVEAADALSTLVKERDALRESAAVAGWNACRKSLYAVCEDVGEEADRIRIKGTVGSHSEEQHAKGYHAGTCHAAKSIARGFNSMEALDDDNLRAALRTLGDAQG